MLTEGKWSWAYGRMEARIKIPRGQGIWPAFWMLGTNIDAGVGWPTCGEIDIMENIGKTSDQGTDHCTIHGPQITPARGLQRWLGRWRNLYAAKVELSPMVSTFMPCSGRPTKSNGFWTPIYFSRPHPPACPAAEPGSSRSRNSSYSTWPSAATGPAIRMEPRFSHNKCWWIMSGFMSKPRRFRFPRPNPMAMLFCPGRRISSAICRRKPILWWAGSGLTRLTRPVRLF